MGRTKLTQVEKTKTVGDVVKGFGPSFFTEDVMNYYRFGSYDNTFPNISRIAEAFAEVLPYAVGPDGKRLETQPRLISALYNPNKQMSGVEFFETLSVLSLVFPKVYILCWHEKAGKAIAGGDITADNICGFTFLENPKIEYDKTSGLKTYTTRSLGQEATWNENEVIEISMNVNPYSILDGYSPSMAAKKWSNVDDYIADYQGGFFKNGAIPAGQFIITAKSVEEFNEIVAEMQAYHRGPSANNNVQYIHKPIDSITGAPLTAQIEWVPFQQANNQMSLQELFDQANKKIDMAFGVPQEVKGYLSNSNYASVSVADYVFARRVVYPKLVKLWAKFTHEMNRITGGLGYAISFDYEIPVLEETRKSQVTNLLSILNAGYTLESAVEALQLPKSFLKLALPEETKEEETRQDIEPFNNKEDADQVQTSKKSMESKKKLVEPNPEIQKAVEEYTRSQIKAAQDGSLFDMVKQSALLKGVLLAAVLALLEENGEVQYSVGSQRLETAGYDTENLNGFYIPEETQKAYEEYLGQIALSYSEDTNESIKRVLEQAEFEGWNKEEIRQALNGIMETDHWRIERIARTETHRAEQMGNLTAMRELAKETGATIWKVWNLNPLTPNHCETCEALNGVRLPLGDSFGDFPAGADKIADAHPNCSCYLTFEIDEMKKIVKVSCPHCKRHLFESDGGTAKGIKCQGCKKHFDFTISKGKIVAVEIEKEIK